MKTMLLITLIYNNMDLNMNYDFLPDMPTVRIHRAPQEECIACSA